MRNRHDYLYIFDFDGTIVDNDGLKDTLFQQYFREAVGVNSLGPQIDRLVELKKGARRAEKLRTITDYMDNQGIEHSISSRALDEFIEHNYPEAVTQRGLRLEKSIIEKLGTTASRFVCSNAPKSELTYLVEFFELSDVFNRVVSCSKSKGEEIKDIAVSQSVDISKVVYVGDTIYDYEHCRAAGCLFFDVNSIIFLADDLG